jgi:hypothetical protein
MATTIINNFISPRSPFEMVIKTNNLSTGSTANNQFRIPHYPTGTYNYKVDWGDGVVEEVRGNTSPTHTYPSVGTYNVKIWGIFAGIYFNNSGDRLKLLQIISADRRNKQTAFNRSYRRCDNLVGDLSNWDVSNGTDFSYMFNAATSFNSDLSNWDVSNGIDFTAMFFNTTSFNDDLSNWDVSNGTNFSYMFNGATSFNGDLSNWDASNGTNFSYMFFNATSFNGDLSNWDASNGTNFSYMFNGAASFSNFPPGFFDNWTATPALLCFLGTWDGCTSLTAQSVENILVSIDTSARSAPAGATGVQADITIDYNTATGSLSTATNTAITNLKAKGWKPKINNVYV